MGPSGLDSGDHLFVEVAFNGPGQLERSTYTYSVPEPLRRSIEPGLLVVAPFRQSRLPGVVVAVTTEPPNYPVRDIESVWPDGPIIPPHALELARWMSQKYLSPLPTVLRLFLPAGRRLRVLEAYSAVDRAGPVQLSATEMKLLAALRSKGPLPPKALAQQVTEATVRRHLRSLMAKGLVEKIMVPDVAQDLFARAKRHDQPGTGPADTLAESVGGPSASAYIVRPPVLTERARAAWEQLRLSLEEPQRKPVAIYGLRFEERLSLYVGLLRTLVKRHKGALLLLPQISSVEEAARALKDGLGLPLAILHSRLGTNRLGREWLRLWSGEAVIAVGSRVAVFAPVRDLSLIIVDEEADESYKSLQSVSYNARDVAFQLSRLTGATMVFCSTVPSMWLEAVAHRGGVSILPPPLSGTYAPQAFEVIDLRRAPKDHRPLVSQRLLQCLDETLAKGGQAVVILNRRGLASSILCRKCGTRVECQRCEAPMTYHQEIRLLVCHHCGLRHGMPQFCEVCGTRDFRFLGVGTERVVADLQHYLPKARIVRLDRDSAPDTTAQDLIVSSFWKGHWNVMVGTSLAIEALDAPAVSLAAVLMPDLALHLPDLDATERVFQMIFRLSLWQRMRSAAKVILETYSPDHHAIRCGVRADPRCFYAAEAPLRAERGYPPFGEFIRLLYTSSSETTCLRQSRAMYELLESLAAEWKLKVDILGPGPAYWEKLGGKHRWHILVKGPDAAKLVGQADIHRGWHIDVDPVTIL